MIMSLQRRRRHRALIIMAIGVVIRRHHASASRLAVAEELARSQSSRLHSSSPVASRVSVSPAQSIIMARRATSERPTTAIVVLAGHCAARCRLEGTLGRKRGQVVLPLSRMLDSTSLPRVLEGRQQVCITSSSPTWRLQARTCNKYRRRSAD